MNTRSDDIERWSAFRVWLYSLVNRSPKSNLAVVEHASPRAGERLLDVGCGPGAALEHASAYGAEVAGVDPSPAMVDRASRRLPSAEIRVGSAEAIPFPDDRFVVVISISSFHHWADPDVAFAEILRVLAPDGRLLIAERKHKRKAGHGLTIEKADRLAETLLSSGYGSPEVDTIEVGRHQFFVVSATAPL